MHLEILDSFLLVLILLSTFTACLQNLRVIKCSELKAGLMFLPNAYENVAAISILICVLSLLLPPGKPCFASTSGRKLYMSLLPFLSKMELMFVCFPNLYCPEQVFFCLVCWGFFSGFLCVSHPVSVCPSPTAPKCDLLVCQADFDLTTVLGSDCWKSAPQNHRIKDGGNAVKKNTYPVCIEES